MKQKTHASSRRLPSWLRVSYGGGQQRSQVRNLISDLGLHTVCESANCPNLGECWERGTATFMILGDYCTRDCAFCAVPHEDQPASPDPDEPERVATAARELNLSYVVVTSVTRDDLDDGGAQHFAETIQALRMKLPGAGVEVLTPDFNGGAGDVAKVLEAGPSVFNHNVETCRRLTGEVRPQADYDQSLGVLYRASEKGGNEIAVKSGAMLGLGETETEIHEMLHDLRQHGVQILTLGQYLPPSKQHWPLDRYLTPDEFAAWRRIAQEDYGFSYVESAPLVRSSYRAEEAAGHTLKPTE